MRGSQRGRTHRSLSAPLVIHCCTDGSAPHSSPSDSLVHSLNASFQQVLQPRPNQAGPIQGDGIPVLGAMFPTSCSIRLQNVVAVHAPKPRPARCTHCTVRPATLPLVLKLISNRFNVGLSYDRVIPPMCQFQQQTDYLDASKTSRQRSADRIGTHLLLCSQSTSYRTTPSLQVRRVTPQLP